MMADRSADDDPDDVSTPPTEVGEQSLAWSSAANNEIHSATLSTILHTVSHLKLDDKCDAAIGREC